MKVYLAGKMTGEPQFNIPKFDRVAADLREAGYEVVSPAELDEPAVRAAALASPDGAPLPDSFGTWEEFLERDEDVIRNGGVEGVMVLPGWETSRGVRREIRLARSLGLPIVYLPEDI